MPTNECIPLFRPGDDLTCIVSAAVIGKRFVNLTAFAPRVGTITTNVTAGTERRITSGTLTFLPTDVGAAITGTGIPASTTIVEVQSGQVAILSANATQAGTPTATITRAIRDSSTGLIPIGPCAAGAKAFGVAAYDQPTIGGLVAIIRGKGSVVPLTSGAAITFNAEVEVDGSGRAIPFSSGAKVGKAMETVGGAGIDVLIELY